VVVGCHQFRIHTSKSVDVYLLTTSNPIIEHSSTIRFAAYPTSLSQPVQTISDNKYTSVQDFSHIRPTPSPNWCILPDEAQRDNWLELVSEQDIAVSRLLEETLPSLV